MTTVELLQQIGLNKYEAEAYYTLLTRGALTGYEVGKFSQVPGSRSYEVLERLLEKGLAFVQPGDPPRYSAQNPQDVFARFRSTMETTLNTLTISLASPAQADTMGEFWIVRGQQNILAQVQTMIANVQASLDLVLPAQLDLSAEIAQARARGARVFHASTAIYDQHILLLVCDGRAALVGTMTPADSCQAVLSSNMALLDVLHGYFLHQQSTRRTVPEAPIAFPQPHSHSHNSDWMDWEARKQRHLRIVTADNRTA